MAYLAPSYPHVNGGTGELQPQLTNPALLMFSLYLLFATVFKVHRLKVWWATNRLRYSTPGFLMDAWNIKLALNPLVQVKGWLCRVTFFFFFCLILVSHSPSIVKVFGFIYTHILYALIFPFRDSYFPRDKLGSLGMAVTGGSYHRQLL